MDVLLSDILHISVEFELNEAGRQHVEGGGTAVLDYYDRVEVLRDDLAEAGEVLDDGACVEEVVR
jgi:hypothetical protein